MSILTGGKEKMYVVQVKPQSEGKVQNYLKLRGFKTVIPTQEIIERRGGSWVGVIKTLFPGYVFVDREVITDKDYYRVLSCDNVLRFLGPKGKPERLQAHEAYFIGITENLKSANDMFDVDDVGKNECVTIAGVPTTVLEIDKRQRRIKLCVELAGEKHILKLSANFNEEQTNESEEQGLIRPLGGSDPL